MKAQALALLALMLPLAACRGPEASGSRAQPPAAEIVYVTPTPMPTLAPTAIRPPRTQAATSAPAQRAEISSANCEAALAAHYVLASDSCLAGPTGYFCNGGLAPMLDPASNALSEPGALAEAEGIERLQSPALSAAEGGGLLWLRLEKNILMDALIVGSVSISNRVSAETGLGRWRSITVESGAIRRRLRRHAISGARWWCKACMVKQQAPSSTGWPPR